MTRARNATLKWLGTIMLAASVIAPGAALANAEPPNAEPQGLYSADELLDAEVYTTKNHQHIGEIDDIILGNQMTIQAFIVETDSIMGLGGKSYVVKTNQVRVVAQPGEKATEPEYTILLDLTAEQLKNQPVYSNSWWNKAQNRAAEAWSQTQEGAKSAWTTIKEGSKSLYQSAKSAVHDAAENVADAAGN